MDLEIPNSDIGPRKRQQPDPCPLQKWREFISNPSKKHIKKHSSKSLDSQEVVPIIPAFSIVENCSNKNAPESRRKAAWTEDAYDKPTCAAQEKAAVQEELISRSEELSSETGCVCSCLYDDPEEAELGSSQDGPCAIDEWYGSDRLHSRRGPQPAGTLHGAHSGRQGQRPSWRSLSCHQGDTGCRRSRRPQAGALQVWSEETQVDWVGNQQERRSHAA